MAGIDLPAHRLAFRPEMMVGNPEISIVMAVHNAADSLPRAIVSVCRQTFSSFEFVIVDDASTDGTRDFLSAIAAKDGRIRILRNVENMGLARSLNRGCEAVKSDYIARMDADDECLEDRLEAQIAFMRTHPEVDVLGTAIHVRDVKGTRLGIARRPCTHEELVAEMPAKVPFYHPTVMMRRQFIVRAKGYDARLRKAQDADLWLRTFRWATFANLPDPKLYYTRTVPSWSAICRAASVKIQAGIRERDVRYFFYALRSLFGGGVNKLTRRLGKL